MAFLIENIEMQSLTFWWAKESGTYYISFKHVFSHTNFSIELENSDKMLQAFMSNENKSKFNIFSYTSAS